MDNGRVESKSKATNKLGRMRTPWAEILIFFLKMREIPRDSKKI